MQWNSNSVESGMTLLPCVGVPATLLHFMAKLFPLALGGGRGELIRLQGGVAAAGEAFRIDPTPAGDLYQNSRTRQTFSKVRDPNEAHIHGLVRVIT